MRDPSTQFNDVTFQDSLFSSHAPITPLLSETLPLFPASHIETVEEEKELPLISVPTNYYLTTLRFSNGCKVSIKSLPNADSAILSVLVEAGARHENERIRGIAHFAEHVMMDSGLGSGLISLAAENDGQADADTAFNLTRFCCVVNPTAAPQVTRQLAALVSNRDFNASDIERQRAIVLSEISRDETEADLGGELLKLLYGKTSYVTQDIAGSASDVYSITKDELLSWISAAYGAENLHLLLVGKISQATLEEAVHSFAGLARSNETLSAVPSPVPWESGARVYHHQDFSTPTCDAMMGFHIQPQSPSDLPTLQVLKSAIGTATFGRLADIRSLFGTYAIGFATRMYESGVGCFLQTQATDASRMPELIRILPEALKGPYTVEEIEKHKAILLKCFKKRASPQDRQIYYHNDRIFLQLNSNGEVRGLPIQEVAQVTAHEVNALAERIFQNPRLALKGTIPDGWRPLADIS